MTEENFEMCHFKILLSYMYKKGISADNSAEILCWWNKKSWFLIDMCIFQQIKMADINIKAMECILLYKIACITRAK